jgi:branched-chain amino acid transport system substrate-binding protein
MHWQRVGLRPTQRLLTMLALCTLLLTPASCSAGSSTTASKHLEIAALFAVSGTDAALQLPAQYGVDLAVSQAHLPDGYTLSVVHVNYAGTRVDDPTVAATAAHALTTEVHALVNDAHVVGVVGPFNSSVTRLVMPITNLAGLSMISPTNSEPDLTLMQYAPNNGMVWSQLHPADHPNRYFRTVANDVEQGQLDAYFASHTLGAKTAFVVEDDSIYGAGQSAYGGDLAQSFTSAFTRTAGHTVVVYPHGITNMLVLAPVVSAIVARNPDLVYYGGVSAGGGAELKRGLVAAGYTKPLLGGDGIANDPVWLSEAQAGAGDTYGTTTVPDVSVLASPRAHAFVAAYETYVADKPDNTLSPYSVMAYDAANALIQALTLAVEHGAGRPLASFRTQTGQSLATSSYQYAGITGDISFDENGDDSGQRIFSVYAVSSSNGNTNQWTFFQLFQCIGSASLSCRSIPSL